MATVANTKASEAKGMTNMTTNGSCIAATVLIALIVGTGGCDKSTSTTANSGGGSSSSVTATAPPVVEKWTKAGLTVSALTVDQSDKVGKGCRTGTVNGVDILLCQSAADAKTIETAGYEWIGGATGSILSHDAWQLCVADRRNADPTGRTINALTKIFLGK
jgi:hypothetical protein